MFSKPFFFPISSRGNPLSLSLENYQSIEKIWYQHNIPQTISRQLNGEPNTNHLIEWHNLWLHQSTTASLVMGNLRFSLAFASSAVEFLKLWIPLRKSWSPHLIANLTSGNICSLHQHTDHTDHQIKWLWEPAACLVLEVVFSSKQIKSLFYQQL